MSAPVIYRRANMGLANCEHIKFGQPMRREHVGVRWGTRSTPDMSGNRDGGGTNRGEFSIRSHGFTPVTETPAPTPPRFCMCGCGNKLAQKNCGLYTFACEARLVREAAAS